MVEQDVKRTDDRQNIQAILDTLKNMRKIIADTVEKTRNLAAMLRPSMLDTLALRIQEGQHPLFLPRNRRRA